MKKTIPLHDAHLIALKNNCLSLKFSVHKRNSYIKGRTITLEEALRCVIFQNKWASSHDVLRGSTKEVINASVSIVSLIDLNDSGQFVEVDIRTPSDTSRQQFIVTQSDTHWLLQDLSLLSCTPCREI